MPYKDPAKRAAYHREYQRAQRATVSQTPGQTAIPVTFRLQTATDALALLAQQVAAVHADQTVTTVERARCIGYLLGISLKAMEAGDTAARLEAVEAVLKLRKAG
jgi:hypothetical protein